MFIIPTEIVYSHMLQVYKLVWFFFHFYSGERRALWLQYPPEHANQVNNHLLPLVFVVYFYCVKL